MKSNILFSLIIVSILLVLCISYYCVKNNGEITITGIVNPTEWDERNTVSTIEISVPMPSDDPVDQDYTENFKIIDDEKGRELLEQIDNLVEVKGIAINSDDGSLTIRIKKFKVLEIRKHSTCEDEITQIAQQLLIQKPSK
ncbi:hypothetical protein JW960_04590 [candidate division KSB1 bacterium]|nr:hypothetical protein [candidate division KSB1 bacterium]